MPSTCRLCNATSFRKVRRESSDGPDLFACTSCSAVFTHPRAWRKIQTTQPVKPSGPPVVDETAAAVRSVFGPPVGRLPSAVVREQSPEEHQALMEAVARANKSKKRR